MTPKEIYRFIIEQSPEPLIKNPVLRKVVDQERLGFYLGKKVPSQGTIEDADVRKAEDALSGSTEVMKVADLQRQGHIGHYYSKGGEVNQLVLPSVDGSRPGYSSESAKRAVLRLPDEGEIDLDKLAKRHNVSAATIGGYRDRNKPNLKSVKKTTRRSSTSGAKYEKRVKVKNYLKNLPDNSNITVLDLADDLKVSRSLIDNILKEKEFKKKKFNLLKKAGSLTDQQFATEYKNFQKSDFFKTGADQEFADYLNDLGYRPQEGAGKFTYGNVGSRRRTLNIKSVATKAVALTDKQILKEAKRLKVKNIKDLSSSELRNKVITARAKENTAKKMKENLEFREQQRKKQKIIMDRFIKKRKSTKEGRALLLAQRRKDKRAEYKRKGLDPLATNADEAIWRDSVLTATNNIDGKGRFSISSGYSKSMKAEDYFSDKIKIKDNQTGKTFTFNTFKNYVSKNASSFGLKNYDEAVKPYRQKFFINDKPNLRTNINFALIPGYTAGDSRSAYTIQHDFGRQINPLKTSLAFYDDNLDEYRIRSDFENAWERSKKSKTPLTDRKKAFNVFKKDLAKLNIQSVPSMVKRERFFGKGLDLTDILKTAKKEGATIPRGTFKEAKEFEKQLSNNLSKAGFKCEFAGSSGGLGSCNDPRSYRKSMQETMQKASQGDNAAVRRIQNLGKIMNKVKGAAKATGYGALIEIGFAAPLATIDWARGANKQEIVSNVTFGLFGKSMDEQLRDRDIRYRQIAALEDAGTKEEKMRKRLETAGGYRSIAQNQQMLENAMAETDKAAQPFIRPNPQLESGQMFDQDKYFSDIKYMQDEMAKEEEAKKQRAIKRGFYQPDFDVFAEEMSYAGGGIASIRRPSAIPPQSGPLPDGLPGVLKRVKNI